MASLEEKKEYPIAYKWSITKNALQRAEGRQLHSQPFDLSFCKCKIFLRPHNNKANIGVLLKKYHYRDAAQEIEYLTTLDVTLSIESARYKNGIQQKIQCEQNETTSEEIVIDNIFDLDKRFIHSGMLVLKVEGCFSKMVPIMRQTFLSNERVETLWNDDVKDFTIVIDGKELKIHKVFLRTASPVFRAMFENENLKEARENRMVITDFTYEILEIAVQLCYGFHLPDALTIQQAFHLLQFFDKYQIEFIKKKVEKFFDGRIQPSNVCEMANAAIIGNCERLRKKCIDHLKKYADEKMAVTGFETLDRDVAAEFEKEMFWTCCETK